MRDVKFVNARGNYLSRRSAYNHAHPAEHSNALAEFPRWSTMPSLIELLSNWVKSVENVEE